MWQGLQFQINPCISSKNLYCREKLQINNGDRAFSAQSSLSLHQAVHTGEKAQKCIYVAKSSIPAVTLQFIGELIFYRNHINVMYVARPLVKLQTLQFIGVFILERKHMDVLSGKAFSHIGKLAVYSKFILERNCINVFVWLMLYLMCTTWNSSENSYWRENT